MILTDRICRAVMLIMFLAALAFQASAATIFRDNFSDGDAEDGMPVTWEGVPGTTLEVEGGSLVITKDVFSFALASAPDFELLDTSVRAQFRLLEGSSIGLVTAESPGGGAIFDDGIARFFNSGPSVQTDFDPKSEDLIMQVDTTAESADSILAQMWIWRPGELMPSDPIVSVSRTIPRPGRFAGPVLVATGVDGSSGAFRYVHVADSHIPEPSTLLMALFGMNSACCYRCRR